jgi:hypothetical protein
MSRELVEEKLRKRVLRLLAKGPAECEPAVSGGKLLLENDKGERIGVDASTLVALASDGLISRNLRTVRLSPEGQAAARREASGSLWRNHRAASSCAARPRPVIRS